MKKDRFLYFIVIALLLVASYFYFSRTNSTLRKELRDFAIEDTSKITKIFMVDKSESRVLLKKVNNKWMVNGKYFARKDAVETLLKTMKRLDVKAPVSRSSQDNMVKNLATFSTKVEIYTGDDKPEKTYYVGGPTQDHHGTFMIMENSSAPFIMHIPGFSGYLSTRYFTKENLWRDPIIFRHKFSDIKSVEVEIPNNPKKSFVAQNNGGNKFSLFSENVKTQNFDTVKLKMYMGRFKRVGYESIASEMNLQKRDSILNSNPFSIISVEDSKNEITKVETYLRPGDGRLDEDGNEYKYDIDRLYAKLENDTNLMVIQFVTFDPLFKELNYFFKK
ncbi:MAG: DUF4340 domain-containing protein [Bacteroidetes bacterium]|jgi:hypothetical protein|nr:DUF4340 domain-containing protein [Bacteroidota bacterium]MBT6687010.1 DUF4340 domain-containing protein [Bacteroidota bacterium]MBT7144986.1 DUF4340 domain-containing protein [Bacteroidota bacterium]MBT7490098.1 DUF4340 domain-containing protein [Bacteroidota bacterium]